MAFENGVLISQDWKNSDHIQVKDVPQGHKFLTKTGKIYVKDCDANNVSFATSQHKYDKTVYKFQPHACVVLMD